MGVVSKNRHAEAGGGEIRRGRGGRRKKEHPSAIGEEEEKNKHPGAKVTEK